MAEHFCKEHNKEFKQTEKMRKAGRGYSHAISNPDGTTSWCNEEDAETYHSPQGDEPLVTEAKKMGAKVTGVDNFKNRAVAISYAKDLLCAGVIDKEKLIGYADKFLNYIENK